MSLSSTHAHLTKLARVAAITGGLGIIAISVMISVDVFLRKFANTTLGGASEIAGMVFAVATAVAYPYVLLDRANIRIDVVYARISVKMRAFLDLIAMLLVLYFAWRLVQSTFELWQKSWTGGTRTVGVLNMPIWIPQGLWVLGFALFALTALFLSVYAIVCLMRRDWATVNQIAGVPSLAETIEEETHIDIEEDHHTTGKPGNGGAQ